MKIMEKNDISEVYVLDKDDRRALAIAPDRSVWPYADTWTLLRIARAALEPDFARRHGQFDSAAANRNRQTEVINPIIEVLEQHITAETVVALVTS